MKFLVNPTTFMSSEMFLPWLPWFLRFTHLGNVDNEDSTARTTKRQLNIISQTHKDSACQPYKPELAEWHPNVI